MNVFVCGFMGSGKTTLINKLRSSTNVSGKDNSEWDFIDLDEEVFYRFVDGSSRKTKDFHLKLLVDWIEEKGRDYFHSKALELIAEYCLAPDTIHRVIAIGGGSLDKVSLALIKSNANNILLWIDVPFKECINRIEKRMGKRYILKGIAFF